MTRLASLRSPVLTVTLGAALGAALLGCGPGSKNDSTGPEPGKGDAAGANDAQLTFEPITLTGTFFTPEGLDRPDMLLARPPKKTTLDKQRAAFQKAKPEDRADAAVVLATMLYEAGQKEADEARRTALLEEARKVLKEAEAGADPKARAVLLHNLAALAYELGDQAGAAEALARAVEASPDDPLAAERRAYLAYYLVRNNANAEAAAAVKGLAPSKAEPDQAYAIAWAAWRAGDLERARAAIQAATEGWDRKGYLPALKRDVLIFAARTGASVDEAVALAKAFAAQAKEPHAYLETLVFMHQAYKYAGRLAESIELVDRIFASEQAVNKADVHRLRLEQAMAAMQLGRPEGVVEYSRQAVEALEACGDACKPKDTEDTHALLFRWARLANTYYATAQDERWYEAARELYALYQTIPGGADAATVQNENLQLENAHKRAKKNAGTHDKSALNFVLQPYASQVLACYDRFLQRDPKLAGQLRLDLEISADGKVTGASSEPAGGESGLAAVASCAVDQARGWEFPKRSMPGVTRASVAYVLQPGQAR